MKCRLIIFMLVLAHKLTGNSTTAHAIEAEQHEDDETEGFSPEDAEEETEYGAAEQQREHQPRMGQSAYGPRGGQRQYEGLGEYGPVAGQEQYGPVEGQGQYRPVEGQGQYGPVEGQGQYGPVEGQTQYGPIENALAGHKLGELQEQQLEEQLFGIALGNGGCGRLVKMFCVNFAATEYRFLCQIVSKVVCMFLSSAGGSSPPKAQPRPMPRPPPAGRGTYQAPGRVRIQVR